MGWCRLTALISSGWERLREFMRCVLNLASTVAKAAPHTSGLHPATRSFMAVRWWVNQVHQDLVALLLGLVASSGRTVTIPFMTLHILLVRQFFNAAAQLLGEWDLLAASGCAFRAAARLSHPLLSTSCFGCPLQARARSLPWPATRPSIQTCRRKAKWRHPCALATQPGRRSNRARCSRT